MANQATIPFRGTVLAPMAPGLAVAPQGQRDAFPATADLCVMLLISPTCHQPNGPWADHTAVLEEAIPQQDKLKVSRQDERTAWDPSHSSVTGGPLPRQKISGRRLDNWFYLSLFGYYCPFFAAQKNDRGPGPDHW
ncbi:MAG: hypothetical protein CM1200mP29_02780 [Verrucomicrobiota bacterium]|nr:MAG: hypothetical protein CM1200mP29_02780 [Verrucomicrobiota bacterium]